MSLALYQTQEILSSHFWSVLCKVMDRLYVMSSGITGLVSAGVIPR